MNTLEEIPHRMAENAAYFWLMHKMALKGYLYNPADLKALEDRIDAQIAGLQTYGNEGWFACEDALAWQEEGEMFTAAVIAFNGSKPKRIEQVLAIGCQQPAHFHALQSALAWSDVEKLQPLLRRLLQSEDPAWLALGISCCALHRRDCGEVLSRSLASSQLQDSPLYYARILKAVGELNRKELLPQVMAYQEHTDKSIAFWATWSAIVLGNKTSLLHLKPYVFANDIYTGKALSILLRSLPLDQARSVITALHKQPENRHSLITGLGVIGDAASLPWLIQQMHNKQDAQLAGLAFAMITGVNYIKQKMYLKAEAMAGEGVDDNDEHVTDDLPWPDPTKVSYWYRQHKQRFKAGQRYLAGRLITLDNCKKVIKTGHQQQRLAAIDEILTTLTNRPLTGGVLEIPRRACQSL